jgi:hypothetical protein
MRILGLVLVGGLALTAPVAAKAGPPGSTTRLSGAGPAPGIVQVWDHGGGWQSMPNGWNGDWRRVPGLSRQWHQGWVSWHRWPNGPPSGWPCCPGPGVPTYWLWGPSGGAFDYPFSDWRGPTGGWGNP